MPQSLDAIPTRATATTKSGRVLPLTGEQWTTVAINLAISGWRVHRLQHKPQIASYRPMIGVALPVVGYAGLALIQRHLMDITAEVDPGLFPEWHTPAHLPLRVHKDGSATEANAFMIRGPQGRVIVVSPAFLYATEDKQKRAYNAVIDRDPVLFPSDIVVTTLAVMASVTMRRLVVGDRDTLTKRRAVTFVGAGLAHSVAGRLIREQWRAHTRTPLLRAS